MAILRGQILLVLAAMVAMPLSVFAHCDGCHRGCKHHHCQDDLGLLDQINLWAKRLKTSHSKCDQGGACDCDARPSCGVESPSCGCEAKPSCGCEMHQNASPVPVFPIEQPLIQMVPIEPAPMPPQAQPIPDTQVNPFQDDEASRIRGGEGHGVRLQRVYRQQFDPQAKNSSSSTVVGASAEMVSRMPKLRLGQTLDAVGSTRRTRIADDGEGNAAQAIFVRAKQPPRLSSRAKPSIERSSVSTLPTQAASQADSSTVGKTSYPNPLR